MKAGTSALVALAAALVAAHPFRESLRPLRVQSSSTDNQITTGDHHKHGGVLVEGENQKRDIVYTTDIFTETIWVTAAPDGSIAACTDLEKALVETTTSTSTPTPSPPPAELSPSTSSSTTTTSQVATLYPNDYIATSPPPSPSTSSSTPSTAAPAPESSAISPTYGTTPPQPSSVAGSGFGITWSPYVVGGCKTSQQAQSEFEQMQGYSYVRVYGTDCNQVALAVQYAQQYGMKVFAGIFYLTDVQSEADIIIDAVNGTWDIIDAISVGNEDVNNGTPVSSVVSAMSQATSILQAAGYNGDIVHVDTQNAFESNPDLCTPEAAGSYITANIHPFFNPQTSADQAAAFVSNQIDLLGPCADSVGNSRVRVTETGWPKQGENDGAAVPSKANQDIVVSGIKALPNAGTAIFLSSFNDPWKAPGPFNCEQYWGILDD